MENFMTKHYVLLKGLCICKEQISIQSHFSISTVWWLFFDMFCVNNCVATTSCHSLVWLFLIIKVKTVRMVYSSSKNVNSERGLSESLAAHAGFLYFPQIGICFLTFICFIITVPMVYFQQQIYMPTMSRDVLLRRYDLYCVIAMALWTSRKLHHEAEDVSWWLYDKSENDGLWISQQEQNIFWSGSNL